MSAVQKPESALVDLQNLNVIFTGGSKPLSAINGVNLSLKRGEVVALLGESGSGKSVTLRALMRLLPEKKSKIEGHIYVAGQNVTAMNSRELTAFRGKVVSMVFQEPMLALDPVYTLGEQISEAVVQHEGVSQADGMKRALELFERVRIPSPERRLANYPHEMSGGMRQRAMIALALACRPQVLLADEPTTALDATVQIQILLLLRELQQELGLGVIFVTHDIGVAVEVADRVAVMYGGRIVESGSVRDIIRNPSHPYTIGLLSSRGHGGAITEKRLRSIPGSPPDLAKMPPGCAFAPRCAIATAPCSAEVPEERVITDGHAIRCIRSDAAEAMLAVA